MGFGIYKFLLEFRNYIHLRYLKTLSIFMGFEYINDKIPNFYKMLIIPYLKYFGAKIGDNCDIECHLIINSKNWYHSLFIGNNTFIGKNVLLDIKGGMEIGNNVVISFGTSIISHLDLGLHNKLNRLFTPQHIKTVVKDNCYIGANSTILMGVTLGEGSFVAAGSVVIKDVEANTMVAGVPAKQIKKIVNAEK